MEKGKTSFCPVTLCCLLRYLSAFHDPRQEEFRVAGTAFMPSSKQRLRSLVDINKDFVASVQKHSPCTEATLAATQKKNAFFSYKGYSAYQPFDTWRA